MHALITNAKIGINAKDAKKKKNTKEIEHLGVNQSPSPKLKHLDLINEISIRFLPTSKEKLIELREIYIELISN